MGAGHSNQAQTIQKVIAAENGQTETVTVEDLSEIIPILPPKEAEHIIEETTKRQGKLSLSPIIPLASFLSEETLDELVKKWV